MRWIGGDCTCAMSAGRSSDCCCCHASLSSVDTRMCSRLRSGSASMPASVSTLVAAAEARSASSSGSASDGRGRAPGTSAGSRAAAPRGCPACRRVKSAACRSRAMRSGRLVPTRPARRASASPRARQTRPASCPCSRASSGLTHGANSPALSRGNVSSRFDRSPFGSTASTGTPSMAASSMQADAEAGLAAARHAEDHGVRDQIGRVVEQRDVGHRRRSR